MKLKHIIFATAVAKLGHSCDLIKSQMWRNQITVVAKLVYIVCSHKYYYITHRLLFQVSQAQLTDNKLTKGKLTRFLDSNS